MRELSKILLSVCTVCALGQLHTASADTNQPGQPPPPPQAPPPVPTEAPPVTSPSPNSPTPPTDVPPDTTPTTTPDASQVPPPPPPPDTAGTVTVTPPPPPPAPVAVVPTESPPLVEHDAYGYGWYEPTLQTGIGVSTLLGGGVSGFTEKTMRNTTSDIGGLWDLRVTIGSHVPIALNLSYVGTATNINGLPTGNKGTLIGTTAEAALQWNVLPHFAWTPYIFGGIGWQRYDVTQTSVSLSDSGMNDHDNLLEVPMGGGFAYRLNGLVFDVRGTFRWTTDQNLVLETPFVPAASTDFVPLHTWEASAGLGYEF